jgi:hypothetical protein
MMKSQGICTTNWLILHELSRTRWRVRLTTDRIVSTKSAFYDSSRIVFDGCKTGQIVY